MEIATNYLELEKMRFGRRLTYAIKLPEGLSEVYLPGLLLQTLVENAVKHGIAPARDGGHVDVVVEARGENSYHLAVVNTGAAFKGLGAESAVPSSTGTGLANSVRRLDLLYGPAHGFTLSKLASGATAAEFSFSGEKR